jgi:acyl-CoA hydrolase
MGIIMNDLTGKRADESFTVMTEMVLTSHANRSGRLFGGQLMSWMDIAGAICAKRHCNCEVVTVSANELSFHKPAMPNDVVIITACLESVGNTSMKVKITAEVELLGNSGNGERVLTCSATFVYVALDRYGKKCPVPKLIEPDNNGNDCLGE